MDTKLTCRRIGFICLALVIFSFCFYLPVKQFDFIGYDDPVYITSNEYVQAGLTMKGVSWAFSEIAGPATYWHPLTWLSHMLDCQLFKMNAGAHHLANALFHAINVALLFLVLARLTGSTWRSAIVAVLFAVHPLQVETVAWVTERKNLLSTAFLLLTILAYHRYVERLKVRAGDGTTNEPVAPLPLAKRFVTPAYVIVFVLFALGLMCKPMLVTLPCILLLLDIWPLRRLAKTDAGSSIPAPEKLSRLIIEKIPLLVLSAASSVITLLAHKQLQSFMTESQVPFGIRSANSFLSYVSYLRKTIWPSDLAAIYPYPTVWPISQFALHGVLLIGVTIFAVWFWKRRPFVLFGWLWFLGTLIPVIGFVQAGSQAMADRFMYLPLIGLLIAVVWGLAELAAIRPVRIGLGVAAAVAIVACGFVSQRQLPFWKNSFVVFERAVAVTKNNSIAHYNLAYAYMMAGGNAEQSGDAAEGAKLLEKAREHYAAAVKIAPSYVDAHNNLAALLDKEGKTAEAIAQYRSAVKAQPKHPLANYNLGILLERENQFAEAAKHYGVAAEVEPKNLEYRFALANAYGKMGRTMEAIELILSAVRENPSSPLANYQAANVMMMQQNVPEALRFYTNAIRLKPNYGEAHYNLATALAMSGKVPEAAVHFGETVRLNPRMTEARVSFARALAETGKPEEAVREYREALKLDPNMLPAILQLGWVLAANGNSKLRNGNEALKLAMRATEMTKKQDPESLDLLGAAYAESEMYSEAAQSAREAIKVANAAGRMDMTSQIGKRLQKYESGQPFRQD